MENIIKRSTGIGVVLFLFVIPLKAQELLVIYIEDGDDTFSGNIGIFDVGTCELTPLNTALENMLASPNFAYNASGDLYAMDISSGNFFSADINDGTLEAIGSIGSGYRAMVFINDSTFYTIRLAGIGNNVGIGNVNSGTDESPIDTGPVYGYGLTFRDGNLYYSNDVGIHLMDREDFDDNELIIPTDFDEFTYDAMVSLRLGCDSTVTYAFRHEIFNQRYFLDIIDLDNQQIISTGCEIPDRITSVASPLALAPPPCPVVLDLDEDNSTAPLLAFQADTACAPSSLPMW